MDLDDEIIKELGFEPVVEVEAPSTAPVIETPLGEENTSLVETPAVIEEPVNEEVTPEGDSLSTDDYLSSITGGRFANEESFSEFFNKSGETETALTNLQGQFNELKIKSEVSPFANDGIKELNAIVQNGGDAQKYMRLSSVKIDDLSNQEALSLKLQYDNGLSKSDADYRVSRKYRLSETDALNDSEHADHDLAREASIDLKVEGQSARESLLGSRLDLMKAAVPATVVDLEAEKAQKKTEMDAHIETFKPQVSKLTDSMQTVEFKANNGKTTFEYSPEGFTKELTEHLNGMIREVGIPNNEDGLGVLQQLAKNHIIVRHFEDILEGVAEQARTITDEEWLKDVNNPSAVNVHKNPESNSEKSFGDRAFELIEAVESHH